MDEYKGIYGVLCLQLSQTLESPSLPSHGEVKRNINVGGGPLALVLFDLKEPSTPSQPKTSPCEIRPFLPVH